MADRSSERDRRVRQLIGNKNPGFDVIGQAQAEIQDAQSELYNHVALQNAQDQSRLREASTISQVAGTLMQQQEGDQLQVQASTMNPSTQATLGKFGVKPQRYQNTTRGVQNQRVVTKSGDTTNIRNENITNNRTDIKITQPSIPIQTPVIPIRGGNGPKEDSTAKFKTWLSNMFARQQNEAEIQRKEYRKKEWNLGRTTSKLMKKISEATSNLGERLDPKNMSSSLGGQLKWLLLIFGATMIGKVWKPMMKFLANLEGGFKAAFGLPMNTDLQNNANRGISIVDKLKEAIGIDSRNEDTNLIQGIGRVFMQGIDKLIDKLQFWFEDRAMAMKEIEFPDMGNIDFGAMGGVLGSAMEGVVASLKNVGQYLGDLMTVALGGSKGKVKAEANRIQRKVNQSLTNTDGKQLSDGDSALITGKGRNYMRDTDFDMFGNLKGKASSTMAMSQSVLSMLNDKSGTRHTAEITSGVSQLFNSADRTGQVVIDPELLLQLGLNQQDLITLQKNGNLAEKPYRIIAVKASDAQKKEMGAYYGNWSAGILSTVGTAAGAMIGTPMLGGFVGGVLGGGVGSIIDKFITYCTENDYYPTLVPADSPQMSEDGSAGVPKMMWVLDKKGADQVRGKITYGMTNKTTDLTNEEFTNYIRKVQENIARKNNIKLKGESTNFENLRAAQAQYKNYQDQWNWKFESTDKNSENNIKYGNWNAAVNTAGNLITRAQSGISNVFRAGGNYFIRKSIREQDIIDNMNYTMDKLIKAGFTREAAAGIAGNIMRECSFNPNLKITDSNGLKSGGIVMWNGKNLDKIEKEFGRDIRNITLDEQLDYLIKELKTVQAINRNQILNTYGLKSGNVFDVMNKASNAGEAANLFERVFEGSQDYSLNGNEHRIGYANEALSKYDSHTGEFRSVQLTTVKNKKPSLINLSNNGNVKPENFSVAWIGDSQTCAGSPQGLWPILVGKGLELGDSFAFFGRSSATPSSYINGGDDKLSDPTTNTQKTSCQEMLEFIISSKPEYVIIALGHNGVAEYSNLVSRIKNIGSKVIGIKMWPIDGSGHGMKSYTSEQMKNMYDGINNVNGWIDLTNINPPKIDGVHINNAGCKYVAEETLRQLIGAEDNSSIINDLSGDIGNIMLDISNTINPNYNKDNNSDNPLLNQFTPEQQEIIKNLRNFQTKNEIFNAQTYLDRGAKINELGDIYYEIETGKGTVRAELNTDGTSALGGYQIGSVNSMYIYNKETGYRDYNLTQDERQSIEKSIAIDITSYLTKYEGKGTPSDVARDEKGNLVKINLGVFTDIDGYSEIAQKAIVRHNDEFNSGSGYNRNSKCMFFWITPTKDLTNYAIIWTETIYMPFITLTEKNSYFYLGPQIYVLGKKWTKIGTLPKDHITSDWQPIAEYYNVKLTPQANSTWLSIRNYLQNGKVSKYKGGNLKLINEKGEEIDKITFLHNFGRDIESYNYVQSIAKKIRDNGEPKYDFKEYLSEFGETENDRLNYIKENEGKDTFFINGKIYAKGGIVIGEYDKEDKSKIKLYDEKTISDYVTKVGQEGLNSNIDLIKSDQGRKAYSKLGMINENDRYNILKKSLSQEKITNEEYERIKKRNPKRLLNGVDKIERINGSIIKYKAFIDVNGQPLFYKIKQKDLDNYLRDINSDFIGTIKIDENKKYLTEEELLEDILTATAIVENEDYNTLNNWNNISGLNDFKRVYGETDFKNSIKDLRNKIGTKKLRGYEKSELDKLTSFLIEQGKLLKNIEFRYKSTQNPQYYYQIITYEDNSLKEKRYYIPIEIAPDPSNYVKQINNVINRNKLEIQKQRFIDSYENSELQAGYQEIADKVNSGELPVIDNQDGTVTTQSGETLFVGKDENGLPKYIIPTAEQAFDLNIKSLNNSESDKKRYYIKMFGAEIEDGNLYLYNKQRTVRAKINLTKPFTTNIREVLYDYQGLEDGYDWRNVDTELDEIGGHKFNPLTGEYKHNWWGTRKGKDVLNAMAESIIENAGEKSNFDLASEKLDEMIKKLGIQVDQGFEAQRREILREKREKERNLDIKTSMEFLDIIAQSVSKSDDELKTKYNSITENYNKESAEIDKTSTEKLNKLVSEKIGKKPDKSEPEKKPNKKSPIPNKEDQKNSGQKKSNEDKKDGSSGENSGSNNVAYYSNNGNKVDINNNFFGSISLDSKVKADNSSGSILIVK